MTKKQFWQEASTWGLVGGAVLFAMNLIAWALRLEATMPWIFELLIFSVLCPLIIWTGRRNARKTGPEGYPYGRAVGFVFATILLAGVVYGVGRFVMMNYIAVEYYEEIYAKAIVMLAPEMREQAMGYVRSPFVSIVAGVFELVFKGGFLGLVLCAFVARKPDMFAGVKPTDHADLRRDENS